MTNPRSRSIPAEEMFLEIVRIHEALSGPMLALFKRFGLTSQQYNVMRVLYVAGEKIPLQSIGERLITRVPDVSRLIDRLQAAKFVERVRCLNDKRVVFVELTAAGRAKLTEVEPALIGTLETFGLGLSPPEITQLMQLLQKLRTNVAAAQPEGCSDSARKAPNVAPDCG